MQARQNERISPPTVRPNMTISVAYDRVGEKEKYEVLYTGESEVRVVVAGESFTLTPNVTFYWEK